MSRVLVAVMLCPVVLVGCRDEDSASQLPDSGSTSEGTRTADGDATDDASTSGSSGSADPDTAQPMPESCASQQGAGPCMVETVVPLPSSEIAFGDFDGDGDVDILARSEETGPDSADQVVVLTNEGGTFGLPVALDYGAEPFADDRPLAISRPRPMGAPASAVRSAFMQGTYGSLGEIVVDTWWMQEGTLQRFYEPTDSPPAGPWFGDFDGDGEVDLVLAPDAGTLDALDLHTCTAGGCSGAQNTLVTGAPAGPWTILGTDTTGDGLDELLVVRDAGEGLQVVVLINDGGSFSTGSTLELGTDLAPPSARLADVDADGRQDIVLTSTGTTTSNTYGSTLHVFNQDGAGGLETGPVIEAGERITGYSFADFDGDGIPDVGLRRVDLAIIDIGLGPSFDGGVSYEITAEPTGIEGLGIPLWNTELVDLDGDGTLDILTVSNQEGAGSVAANVLLAHS